MSIINILDQGTINKIAAGEVVERPANVVKELVENSIDAGADNITVEIKEGGIQLIRVTDNGCGIEESQIKKAFLRHATSKIVDAGDLERIESLGFRGEALSSIAAVCQVEMVTKTKEQLCGYRVTYNSDGISDTQEIGAPDGTTILVRNIFYNTPARKKFLKTPMTEAGYISDMMQHIALSRPDIAFKFINNGQTKFFTSGNGNLRDVIYRIYGKETQKELIMISEASEGIKLDGYLGKPILNRSNRSFITVFINGRYIKSNLVNKAIEEGYKGYLMQHKYPFVVLHFTIDTRLIDVNVHPTKLDIRILNQEPFIQFVVNAVHKHLLGGDMIPEVKENIKPAPKLEKQPEPFENNRIETIQFKENNTYSIEQNKDFIGKADKKDNQLNSDIKMAEIPETEDFFDLDDTSVIDNSQKDEVEKTGSIHDEILNDRQTAPLNTILSKREFSDVTDVKQLDLFEESIVSKTDTTEYEIIGQIFDTYWLVAFQDKLYMIDQHAAHEKIKYEHFVKHLHEKDVTTQLLLPPVILSLSDREKQCLLQYFDQFSQIGFVIEEFGGNDYAVRGVPTDLYGCNEKELLLSIIDELMMLPVMRDNNLILDRIATMSCKAAIKGNMKLSYQEAEVLIKELLTLDNPFQCPHGRPTIVSMSKYEIEKKFKRIL